ncbi:ABC transporter ATP-binding protein [Halalkalibacter krulwichiae]|uniref:Oligopeptide transport ATP-binding protein OppF n=1 Tax=Halalkalibacter krulwichiae TaxID=199441 RepID=A0A1X9MGK1_9BACI|nr:ATP-binding cassette domain-containing protein [Halalkalibacter krulwichiae]ARK31243.1 Oligopeptide transport ATP-binding protein OppF [Halalkalibacter krulwichiae]
MLLEAKKVSFRYYKDVWLFQDVDFQLQSGEVVGLRGPSGCGKTTFARILSGYEKPHTGLVSIDHEPVQKKGYQPVQLIFQHPEKAVNPKWKMKSILEEGGQINPDLLELLGIQREWLNRWPNELSGGELQRFCVARALNDETKFIIADEMTTMLDAITQAQIWSAVLEIVKQKEIGLLVISHEQALIERLCNRVIDFNHDNI